MFQILVQLFLLMHFIPSIINLHKSNFTPKTGNVKAHEKLLISYIFS